MKRLVLAGLVLALGAFLLAPSTISPEAWTAPAPVPLEGPLALNDRLAKVERWATALIGPEAIAVDADGSLLTGLADGRIVRLRPGRDEPELIADTHGRPLGLARHPDGRLYLCDVHRGLLALDERGTLEVLSSHVGGVPLLLADDLAITRAGRVYFTDASARFSLEDFTLDLLEHQRTGRVLEYDPATKQTRVIATGFNFANGLALSPDERHLVVAETGAYQLWRIWLEGPKAGTREAFGGPLPAFPDNLRFSPTRQVYWVALGSPRNPLVDALDEAPWVRGLVGKLPKALLPKPERHAFVVAVDLEGRVVESLQHRAPDSYSPIASVIEHEGFLYLGSFVREGVARVKLGP